VTKRLPSAKGPQSRSCEHTVLAGASPWLLANESALATTGQGGLDRVGELAGVQREHAAIDGLLADAQLGLALGEDDGGVFTDLIAALVGAGWARESGRINPLTGFGMFEPAHGSASKYTGLGVVLPMATVRALAMLLEIIGEPRSARRVEAAVDQVLATGVVYDATARSGVSTTQATDHLLDALASRAVAARLSRAS
jgi:Isocitrate/isopropylmalate dehydrogenase